MIVFDRYEFSWPASISGSFQATVELANKDKVHLESCIEDLTASNRQAARDRDEISQRFVTARERVVELEDCLKQAEQELKRNAEALRVCLILVR